MSDCCSKKNKENEVDLENLDGLICYCFKKSKNELFKAVKNNEEKLIVDEIKSKMKNPGCFCETSNPNGKCCLRDVLSFIKAVSDSKVWYDYKHSSI